MLLSGLLNNSLQYVVYSVIVSVATITSCSLAHWLIGSPHNKVTAVFAFVSLPCILNISTTCASQTWSTKGWVFLMVFFSKAFLWQSPTWSWCVLN